MLLKKFHLPLTFFPAAISLLVGIIGVIIETSSRSASSPPFLTSIEVWIFTIVMIIISALCLIFDITKRFTGSLQEKYGMPLTELPWEREIRLGLERASREVENALEIAKDESIDIDEITHTAYGPLRAALLLLSATIEEQIIVLLQEAGLQSQINDGLSHEVLDEAAEKGLIPLEMVSEFHDFASTRNKIAQDANFEIDEETFLPLLSTGIELLKSISAKRAAEV